MGLLLAQLINIILMTFIFGLPLAALYKLSKQQLDSGVALGWAALIVLVPVLGAVAFLLWTPPRKAAN